MRAMRCAALILLAACSSPPTPVARPIDKPIDPAAPNPELSSALAPLAWWLGDWSGEHGSEHWNAAGGAMFGVALLRDGSFEVLVIDDAPGPGKADGVLRLYAMPGGMKSVEFKQETLGTTAAKFTNPTHDFPKSLEYRRAGDNLSAIAGGDGKAETFAFTASTMPRAPELEAADKAFSDDTGKRGVEGWVAAFAERGSMMTAKGRVEGHAAITETMKGLLSSGTLAWSAIASGIHGDLGYTVGKATFTGSKAGDAWRSSYVTIWKKLDGTWKVWFDTGRVVNE